ncbi:hypothetical protein [Streptomyces sp. HB2AG]|uniref:hypothetical protein n=1 Tax=Streptomyces sp. HB2AG TaxID=2983400 RepID=UPI0022AB33FE|nr:hypothetical protein [Streptomyces sp. HB2AG]MCZ2524681.1 hypothetical protein [Streptomyces sp. HB2AG]
MHRPRRRAGTTAVLGVLLAGAALAATGPARASGAAPHTPVRAAPASGPAVTGHAYRFVGEKVAGGGRGSQAPEIGPGQYLDTIGPGETRWYAAELDASSAADLSATAVPRPGSAVASGDGLDLRLRRADEYAYTCGTAAARFGRDEGAGVLTAAVSRVPGASDSPTCDRKGRYLLSVTRVAGHGPDRDRWPLELRMGTEGARPDRAASGPGGGPRPEDGPRPGGSRPGRAGGPRGGTAVPAGGGSGFNDARRIGPGEWRDEVLPARTRFYRIRLGWGQRLRYTVESGGPAGPDRPASPRVRASVYSPGRARVSGARGPGTQPDDRVLVAGGTVPVAWANRWDEQRSVASVRSSGDYYLAVSWEPGAKPRTSAALPVVLRVSVLGEELAGPQQRAPAAAGSDAPEADSVKAGDTAPSAGRGFMIVAAALGAAGLVLATFAALAALRQRSAYEGPGVGR